jgi:hypothetical protein
MTRPGQHEFVCPTGSLLFILGLVIPPLLMTLWNAWRPHKAPVAV